MSWTVYLSGEIDTDWRERIQEGGSRANSDIALATPSLTMKQVMISVKLY